jgi:DmsE family decaheme c-type cytochrome
MTKLTPLLATAILLLAAGAAVRAQDTSDEDCGMCHDDVAAAFAQTPHGLDRDDVPGCSTCHGDGTEHMDEGGDPELIAYPRGAEAARICAACHNDLHSAFEGGAVHGRAGVACDSCHRIHNDEPLTDALLIDDRQALCASCHPRQVRTFSRPYGHRLGRAGLDCVSCHNPHGGPGERSVKVDRAGDTACVSCHADLRGPYVFPHVTGVTGGCDACHEPHGSSNPHALRRSRVDQLCLECHSPITTTLGSQPPSTHDLRSPRYRNCTICHVAVHGSNTSPTLRK